MVEFCECSVDIAGHGDVDVSFAVMPIEGQAAIQCAGPVDCDIIIRLEGVDEMHCIGFGVVLDAKVVNAENESGSFGAVSPKAGSKRHWFIAVRGQFCDELVESNDAGFLETVHASSDFEIDVAVVGNLDVVSRVIPDFLWDSRWWDTHILKIFHRCAKVVIFDVKAHVAGTVLGIRYNAVDVNLDVEHGDDGGAGVAGVVKFIAAGGHADSMCFLFLWSNVVDEISIGYLAINGDLGFLDNENGSSAGNAVGNRSIGSDAVGV